MPVKQSSSMRISPEHNIRHLDYGNKITLFNRYDELQIMLKNVSTVAARNRRKCKYIGRKNILFLSIDRRLRKYQALIP